MLSDASNFRREPGATVLTGLLGSAALLRDYAGIAATALLVSAEDTEELIADLRRVAPDFSCAYLTLTDPARAAAAQAALAGTLAVITDQQTTAIALTAAMLSSLDRRGIGPAAGRVVIVGAERNPLLGALAVAAGIGEVDRWSLEDAHNFPLQSLARRGAIVIDLLGAARHRDAATAAGSPTPVIALHDPTTPLLALPHLLRTIQRLGRPPDLAECLACARALVECTPPGQILPALSGPALSDPAVKDPPGPDPAAAAVVDDAGTHRDEHAHPVR